MAYGEELGALIVDSDSGNRSKRPLTQIKSSFASCQSTQRAGRPWSGLQRGSAFPGGAPSNGFVVWSRSGGDEVLVDLLGTVEVVSRQPEPRHHQNASIRSTCATRRWTQHAKRHALTLFSAPYCRSIHPGRDPSTCVAWRPLPPWRSSGPKLQRLCAGSRGSLSYNVSA